MRRCFQLFIRNVNKKLTKSQPIKKVIGNTTSALTETSEEKKKHFPAN